MDVKPAHRVDALPIYFFAALEARVKSLQAQGVDVIKLDIGSPDGPPPDFIIDALVKSAGDPRQHGYAGYYGIPKLRQAMVDYYARRFGVPLNVEDEVLPLLGSKEGIAHMALAWLDPGDLALVPDPGYPTYGMGACMAGADTYAMPLLAKTGFLPDLDAIPPEVARRARLMWLNYPNNPTGAVADMSFFEKAVDFCRRHDILLCHDAPYADVCFDGYRAPSLLAVPGAREVAIEFNSLSKSHNMAGWRVGMAVGNKVAVRALLQVKSNVDSGIFLPIQEASVAALTGDQTWIQKRNLEYQRRRDILYDLLVNDWRLPVAKPQASLYLWPRIPEDDNAADFAGKILTETGVSLTPGSAFGRHGEGYLRISVGQTTDRVIAAVERLRKFKI
jgi:LL-diaminopimelate aminotransferase